MKEITILGIICIIFEVYHIFAMKSLRKVNNTVEYKMKGVKAYDKIYDGLLDLHIEDFDSSLLNYIADLYNAAKAIGSKSKLREKVLRSIPKDVLKTYILGQILEIVYMTVFCFFIYQISLRSVLGAIGVFLVVVTWAVASHNNNKLPEGKRSKYIDLLDSCFCIAIYAINTLLYSL